MQTKDLDAGTWGCIALNKVLQLFPFQLTVCQSSQTYWQPCADKSIWFESFSVNQPTVFFSYSQSNIRAESNLLQELRDTQLPVGHSDSILVVEDLSDDVVHGLLHIQVP